jgi:hypothetical protein
MTHLWTPLKSGPARNEFPLKDFPEWVHKLARRMRSRSRRGRPKLSKEMIEIVVREMERIIRERGLPARSAAPHAAKELKKAHGIDRSQHSVRRIFRSAKT